MLKEYQTVESISGPLLFVKGVSDAKYGELVKIRTESGFRLGQVLESSEGLSIVQVFEGTRGLDVNVKVRFTGDVLRLNVSESMLGRIFSGLGKPIDDGPGILSEESFEVTGASINPVARDKPSDFIQTGISTIDLMTTLVRGQKLPIFSGAGLPHNQLAAQIVRQAKVLGKEEKFAVVFAAIGIIAEEANFFMHEFESTGALEKSVVFLNLASDPTIERILTPKLALTTAEYLAFKKDMHVLVIMTDMTKYCEALREISAARNEVPSRRGYPGYMYTDLATLYERAGRIKGSKGSITQLPILTMPSDDITHPVPDLTGYITEGQVVLSRALHAKAIFPPINPLPSLSRLMNLGIGSGKTREDHKNVSDQIYSAYAEGQDLRSLAAIVGEGALSERDKAFLGFADIFEKQFITQGNNEERSIENTLKLAWSVLENLPKDELKKIKLEFIEKYMSKAEPK